MSEGIVVRVHDTLDTLAPCADEWRQLAVAAGNLFVTPEWASSWLEIYGEAGRPAIRTAHVGDRLVGVLPMVRASHGAVRFLGDGVGDVFEPLVAADAPPGTLDALFESVRTGPDRLLVLTNVHRGAPWRASVGVGFGRARLIDRETVLPYIDLAGLDWDGFLATRSGNFRSQVRRKLRALDREFEVTWRLTGAADELDVDVARLFALHDLRWEGRGGSGVSSERARAFVRVLAERALESGWLRLWTLELDGAPVAAWLGWRIGPRYAYYMSGFDPEQSRLSPGLAMLAHTIKAAIAEDAHEYDFLLGSEAYKSRFASARREVETEIVGDPWSREYLVVRADTTMRRIGRALPEGLRQHAHDRAEALSRVLPLGRYR